MTKAEMKLTPQISLVVAAMTPDLGIGMNGKLPWRLKQEILYFRDITSACPEGSTNAVIMGHRTWESIPKKFRPLPNRVNVILSRSFTNKSENGIYYYNSMDSILEAFHKSDYLVLEKRINKIFIIGGAQVYNAFINDDRVDSLLLTNVSFVGDQNEKPQMDCFLNWDLSKWNRRDTDELKKNVGVEFTEGLIKEGDYEYEYTLWDRK